MCSNEGFGGLESANDATAYPGGTGPIYQEISMLQQNFRRTASFLLCRLCHIEYACACRLMDRRWRPALDATYVGVALCKVVGSV